MSVGQDRQPLIRLHESRLEARLLKLDAETMHMESADHGNQQIDFDSLVSWGSWKDGAQGPQVILRDASVLIGELIALTELNVGIRIHAFGDVTLPREAVSGIVLRLPTEQIERDRLLRELHAARRDSHRVALTNGDQLEGLPTAAGNSPASGEVVSVQIGPSSTVIPLENISEIAFRQAATNSATSSTPRLWLGLRDGTRLAVTQLSEIEMKLQLHLQCGVTVSVESENFWSSVNWVQPRPAKFTFLSDRPDVNFKHVPWLLTTWPLGVDRNVLGGSLRSAGRRYEKGLGMHSAARAAYQLDGKFHWLDADLDVDDLAGDRGSVVFRVFVDRAATGAESKWELGYESPVVRGGSRSIPIRVDVSNAQRIALVVDFADRGDECDYADWLLARLIP